MKTKPYCRWLLTNGVILIGKVLEHMLCTIFTLFGVLSCGTVHSIMFSVYHALQLGLPSNTLRIGE